VAICSESDPNLFNTNFKGKFGKTGLPDKQGVNLPNILRAAFSCKRVLRSFSLITVWLCNFLEKEYWRKSYSSDVGEIDYRPT